MLCCSCNPIRCQLEFYCQIEFYLENLNRSVALYSSHYENFVIMEDFTVEANDSVISVFSDIYDLKSLTKEPTCYKNPSKSSCIDHILTNKPRSIQRSCVIETGLSDFGKVTVTVMKTF